MKILRWPQEDSEKYFLLIEVGKFIDVDFYTSFKQSTKSSVHIGYEGAKNGFWNMSVLQKEVALKTPIFLSSPLYLCSRRTAKRGKFSSVMLHLLQLANFFVFFF